MSSVEDEEREVEGTDHPEGRGGPGPNPIRDRAGLAAALTGRRRELGLTVRAVAERMNTPSATVGGYFSARHLPSATRPEMIVALLDALEIDPADRQEWADAIAVVRTRSARRSDRNRRNPQTSKRRT